MIAENAKAPDFTLPDSTGNMISLSNYKGKKVLLVFYPGDDTPVCTTQLCSYRDNFTEFTKRDITILAISIDTIDSHKQFGEKNSLPFTLLSDHDKQVSRLYDAMDFLGMSKRAYVLIDEQGRVRLAFNDLLPLFYQSTRDLLAKIDAMKPAHQ
ncbi:MAG: peroxiredoxin [Chlorobium sp.]|jgi:peroxiredoxin Q/BCP|uniref:peroxiredoxin n=1 Tax=Chlorobium sp. TaxID=1095 RepID=UPI001DC9F1D9|nr:peroxiredoxin [Chlorobium sp.]MBN1278795.1 peroxiredoxin [Chlorobiaceae bacterium]MCF8216075.1 peroxiredoxin [Chlorobium sp.]MCF8270976.1 peroxiredoxin [Chlorobium sp.]MCF8287378.1 peroxiredoxin [Chlorobium sp.]MCF8290889.1 peroxiredoxin [Chlorobium sp.]